MWAFARWWNSPLELNQYEREKKKKLVKLSPIKHKTCKKCWIGCHLTIISARGTFASSTLLLWRLWMSLTVPRLWAKSPSTELRCSSPTVTSSDISGSRIWPPASLRACVQRSRNCCLVTDSPAVQTQEAVMVYLKHAARHTGGNHGWRCSWLHTDTLDQWGDTK